MPSDELELKEEIKDEIPEEEEKLDLGDEPEQYPPEEDEDVQEMALFMDPNQEKFNEYSF